MENQNPEEKKSCCETKKCCGCKVMAALALLLVGGGIGFFAGRKCGLMCADAQMHSAAPAAPAAPAQAPKPKK
jgi:hypothetical protein